MGEPIYPTVIDKSVGLETRGTLGGVSGAPMPSHTDAHLSISARIVSLETKVGVDSSNDPNSIDYQLSHLADPIPGSGDMTKAVYDSDNNGSVDLADRLSTSGQVHQFWGSNNAWVQPDFGDLTNLPNLPPNHAPTHEAGGSDLISLDALSPPGDNTKLNASPTAHGLLLKLANTGTQFLCDDGTWQTPAGGGGGGSGDMTKAVYDIGNDGIVDKAAVLSTNGSANQFWKNGNVWGQPDYTDLTGTPTLGTAAAKNIPASGNASATEVVYGSDTRLTDSRTPASHATSHKSGGSDSIKLDELAAPTDITTLNATSVQHGLLAKTSGTATDFVGGDNSCHAHSTIAIDTLGSATDITTLNCSSSAHGLMPKADANAAHFYSSDGTQKVVPYSSLGSPPTLGTSAAKDIPAAGDASATQVVYGTDTRLTNARTPSAHATTHKSGGTDSIKLDELATPTDITTLNATSSQHGLLVKVSGTATDFIGGDNACHAHSTIAIDTLGAATDITTLNCSASAHGLMPKADGTATHFYCSDGTQKVIPTATSTLAGLVPAPPNNTYQYLRGDATFVTPPCQTQLTSSFTIPAVNSTQAIAVMASNWTAVGQTLFISDGTHFGFYEITTWTSTTAVTITNRGYAGNTASGTTMANNSPVNLVSPGFATSTQAGFVPTPSGTATNFFGGDAAFHAHTMVPLDTLGTPTDITTLNATSSAHGLLAKTSGTATDFIGGDNASHAHSTVALDTLGACTDITTRNATSTQHGLLVKVSGTATDFIGGDNACHAHSTVALDTLGATTDITTLNASTSAHGLLPKLDNTVTHFLNGQGGWTTPIDTKYLTTNASFTVPAINATVNVTVGSATDMVVGQTHIITDGTLFMVGRITVIASLVITYSNQGGDGSVSGSMGAGHVYFGSGIGLISGTSTDFLGGDNAFHAHSTVAIDTLGAATDITALNCTTAQHGLMPKMDGTATHFYSGDGTQKVIPSFAGTTPGLVPTSSNGTAKFLREDAAWITVAGYARPKSYAYFGALDGSPPATLYAVLGTRNSIPVLAFNDSATWTTVFLGVMPDAAILTSGLIVNIFWMGATATSGNVRWNVSFERMTTDEDADSFDTAVPATGAANGTSGILTVTPITVTTIDGITAGDSYRLLVQRLGADGADTMTGDAQISAVEIRSASAVTDTSPTATASGQVTVNFGSVDGGVDFNSASVTVTAAWVTSSSCPIVNLCTGGDHLDSDDIVADDLSAFVANIVVGASFDIVVVAGNDSSGQYAVNWLSIF